MPRKAPGKDQERKRTANTQPRAARTANSNGSEPASLTVTRSYTMRLRGEDHAASALWQTHRAMNNGAEVFATWLLTLGGGISPGDISPEERLLVTLAWITVEGGHGVSESVIERGEVEARLAEILASRGVTGEAAREWAEIVGPTLRSQIRDDANWIDRSGAFDLLCGEMGLPDVNKARADALLLWRHIFGADVFKYDADAEGASAKVTSSGAGMRTNHVFSHIFGGSTEGFGKTDTGRHKLHYPAEWADYLRAQLLAQTGMRETTSQERTAARAEGQSVRASGAFMREMFFRGAEAIAGYRTKLRSQEAERHSLRSNDAKLREMESAEATGQICAGLDALRERRAQESGALHPYILSKRALVGWADLVDAWAGALNADERRGQIARLQGEAKDAKWGDVTLFAMLADDAYIPVWRDSRGRARPELLLDYAHGWQARREAERLKVAAFRHIDPYDHPIFARFGQSRPDIKFSPSEQTAPVVQLVLWDGKSVSDKTLRASSIRLVKELVPDARTNGATSQPPRKTRLALLALKCAEAEADRLGLGSLVTERERALADLFVGKPGASLLANRAQLESSHEREEKIDWHLSLSLDLRPEGPWLQFLKAHKGMISPVEQGGQIAAVLPPRRQRSGRWLGLAYPFKREDFEVGRGGELSAMPGLRILGVDLRQRFGAACALLESVSAQEFAALCDSATSDGRAVTTTAVSAHIEGVGLFRRTADDDAPACWARVVYSRLLKLPGESPNDVRPINRDEHEIVAELSNSLKLPVPEEGTPYLAALSNLVYAVQLSLRRVADLAKIAAALRAGRPPANWKQRLTNQGVPENKLGGAPDLVADYLAKRFDEASQKIRAALRLLARLIQGGEVRLHAPGKGGLSLARIEMLEDFYRLQKSFQGRPTPDRPEGAPVHEGFAASLREKIRRLKRQRTRLLASLIISCALGEDERGEAKYPYAHCVVIEDLSHYGFDARQPRRMNRALSAWVAASIRDALAEACQLHGLHLRQTEAAYTSRQDARTGRPAMRCYEMTETAFFENNYWARECERAQARSEDSRASARDLLLLSLRHQIRTSGASANRTVLVPADEGMLLVSTDDRGRVSKQQVGLNAAVNIGFSALADPSNPISRWRIASQWNNTAGRYVAAKSRDPFVTEWAVGGSSDDPTPAKGVIVNLWRDLSVDRLEDGDWRQTQGYWRRAEHRICSVLTAWRG